MNVLRTRIQRYAFALIAILTVIPLIVFTLIHNSDRSDRAAHQRVASKHLRAMALISEMTISLHTVQLQTIAGKARPLQPFIDGLQRNLQSLAALEHDDPEGVRNQVCARIQQRLERAIEDERSDASQFDDGHVAALTLQLAQLFRLHAIDAQRDIALLPAQTLRQRQVMWLTVAALLFIAFIVVWRIVKLMRNSVDQQARIQSALHDSRERVHQMQKVEAMGQLIGGVAHDFNNLMTAILGNAQLLLLDKGLDGSHRRGVEQIEDAAERAAKLTRQLLTFSRKQSRAPGVIQFNQLLTNLLPQLTASLASTVSITHDIAQQSAAVRIDPSQVETLVRELLSNAVDACVNGGSVTLTTANVAVDDQHRHVDLLGRGRFCHMQIVDTGCGMDAATRARAFEPFFSGSDSPERKGLGLAAAHGIVQSNDGHILLESAPGAGARVDVWLPLVDEVPADRADQTDQTLTGTQTILVVDDEAPIRDVLKSGLTQLGYRVLEAASGDEAIALCESYPDTIHMLICDVVMPNLNGAQIAQRITALRPHIAVLLMSGYADDVLARHGHVVKDYMLIDKPFQINELAALLRRTLAADEGAR